MTTLLGVSHQRHSKYGSAQHQAGPSIQNTALTYSAINPEQLAVPVLREVNPQSLPKALPYTIAMLSSVLATGSFALATAGLGYQQVRNWLKGKVTPEKLPINPAILTGLTQQPLHTVRYAPSSPNFSGNFLLPVLNTTAPVNAINPTNLLNASTKLSYGLVGDSTNSSLSGTTLSTSAATSSPSPQAEEGYHNPRKDIDTPFGMVGLVANNFANTISSVGGIGMGFTQQLPLVMLGEGLGIVGGLNSTSALGTAITSGALALLFMNRGDADDLTKTLDYNVVKGLKGLPAKANYVWKNISTNFVESYKLAGTVYRDTAKIFYKPKQGWNFLRHNLLSMKPKKIEFLLQTNQAGKALVKAGMHSPPLFFVTAASGALVGSALLATGALANIPALQKLGLHVCQIYGALDNISLGKWGLNETMAGKKHGPMLMASGGSILGGQPGLEKLWGRALQDFGCALLFGFFVVEKRDKLMGLIGRNTKSHWQEITQPVAKYTMDLVEPLHIGKVPRKAWESLLDEVSSVVGKFGFDAENTLQPNKIETLVQASNKTLKQLGHSPAFTEAHAKNSLVTDHVESLNASLNSLREKEMQIAEQYGVAHPHIADGLELLYKELGNAHLPTLFPGEGKEISLINQQSALNQALQEAGSALRVNSAEPTIKNDKKLLPDAFKDLLGKVEQANDRLFKTLENGDDSGAGILVSA